MEFQYRSVELQSPCSEIFTLSIFSIFCIIFLIESESQRVENLKLRVSFLLKI